jgi:hypothetical protein
MVASSTSLAKRDADLYSTMHAMLKTAMLTASTAAIPAMNEWPASDGYKIFLQTSGGNCKSSKRCNINLWCAVFADKLLLQAFSWDMASDCLRDTARLHVLQVVICIWVLLLLLLTFEERLPVHACSNLKAWQSNGHPRQQASIPHVIHDGCKCEAL